MKTLQFKTNVMCGACVEKITPFMNETAGAGNWSVDLANPAKILTVHSAAAQPTAIKEALQKAGYVASEAVETT